MDDAFETLLVAWLAFAFLPERPTRSQGGTDGSNPLSSASESLARRFRGIERAIEPSRRMLACPVDQSERSVEPVPSSLFLPVITHLMAVWRVPAAGPKHWHGVDPQPAGAQSVKPVVADGGQVADRGDPALHEFAQ